MRLIDADAIRLPKGFFEEVDNVPKFYEWLNEQPTIEERKTGRWIEQNNHDWEYSKEYRCSECGKQRLVTIPKGWNWNYCPNCGARMVNENE